MQSISEQIDSYIKRTIVNAVKDFKNLRLENPKKKCQLMTYPIT